MALDLPQHDFPGSSAKEAAEKRARTERGIHDPDRIIFDTAEPINDPKTGKPSYRIRLKFPDRRKGPQEFVSLGETIEEFTFVAFRRIIPKGIYCSPADASEADIAVTATGEKFTLTIHMPVDLTSTRHRRKQQELGANTP